MTVFCAYTWEKRDRMRRSAVRCLSIRTPGTPGAILLAACSTSATAVRCLSFSTPAWRLLFSTPAQTEAESAQAGLIRNCSG